MSEPDSGAPSERGGSDDSSKSESPVKPHADGIRRIDTMIGSHLPGLIEEEALKQAAAAQEAKPEPRLPAPGSHFGDAAFEPDVEGAKKWKSPLQVGPDWLVALKSIPLKLVAIAVGGLAVGALLTLSMRGCSDHRQLRELDARVALLERTTAVSSTNDAGAAMAIATAAATTSAPTGDACASAKSDAYAAWQDALVKAKQLAGPAETQCGHYLTQQHRQTCLATATAGLRLVQIARDAAAKGGAAARDAVKNVRDDARNGSIATAKEASRAAFAACDDGKDL